MPNSLENSWKICKLRTNSKMFKEGNRKKQKRGLKRKSKDVLNSFRINRSKRSPRESMPIDLARGRLLIQEEGIKMNNHLWKNLTTLILQICQGLIKEQDRLFLSEVKIIMASKSSVKCKENNLKIRNFLQTS